MTLIRERHRPGVLVEERAFIEAYDASAFPRVAVTADVALLTLSEGRLGVLLIERAYAPFAGHWALPGGFVREGEDLDAAAARELSEETRLSLGRIGASLEQLRTYSAPDRDPRMWVVSTAFVALLSDVGSPRAGGDAARASVWPIDDLVAPNGPWLAFDHNVIVSDAIEWARARIETTADAAGLIEAPFTISALRGVYEAIWGTRLDPANFRRKVLSTPGFVEPTGRRVAPAGGGRPAELYERGGATRLELPLRRPPEASEHRSDRRKIRGGSTVISSSMHDARDAEDRRLLENGEIDLLLAGWVETIQGLCRTKMRGPAAEDVAQAVCMRLWTELKLGKHRNGRWPFRVIVYAVIGFTCKGWYEKGWGELEWVDIDSPLGDDFTDEVELRLTLEEFVTTLPPGDGEMARLWLLQRLEDDQIAERLGKKPNAIYQARYRVVSRLKEWLEL